MRSRNSIQIARRFKAFIAIVAVVMTGCGPILPQSTTSDGATDRVVRLAGDDWGLPQPFTFSRGPGHILLTYVFDTLVAHDAGGITPWLATEWSANTGATAWDFTLRKDVRFQDNTPLTARDVVFTFEYLRAHPVPWFSNAVDLVRSASAVDDYHLHFELTRPSASFLTSVAANVVVLPRHIWESVENPAAFSDAGATMGSMGSN